MLYFYMLMVVQIVVESFPISSSGHVQLWQMFLQTWGVWHDNAYALFCGIDMPLDMVKHAFDFALQGPTLAVLAVFFIDRWWFLLRDYKKFWRQIFWLFCIGAVADALTAGWYFVFAYVGTQWFPLGIGFVITACMLYSLRWCVPGGDTRVSLRTAMLIGFMQGVALLPGISRMGSTFVVARWLGLRPRTALEFSLLLQYPLIAAGFLSGVWTLGFVGMQAFFTVKTLVVIFVSSVVAYYGLRLTMRCAVTNRLWRFAYYMIFPLCAWLALR